MNKALRDSDRSTVAGQSQASGERHLDWRRKMSDHIAYALLIYTGLQIFVTMSALRTTSESILPYFALVVLVAAIIPGCRLVERRWETLDDDQAADPELEPHFKRDRMMVWTGAIGLPFVLTGLFKLLALLV